MIVVTPLVIGLVVGRRSWHQINAADPDRHLSPRSVLRMLSAILSPPGPEDRDESRQRSYRMTPLDVGTGNILTHGCSSGRLASRLAAVMRLHGSAIRTIQHREKILHLLPLLFLLLLFRLFRLLPCFAASSSTPASASRGFATSDASPYASATFFHVSSVTNEDSSRIPRGKSLEDRTSSNPCGPRGGLRRCARCSTQQERS